MKYQKRLFVDEGVPHFDGETYDPRKDHERLSTALGRVWNLMRDEEWRTLKTIAHECGTSEAGASARLRDLRKEKFRELLPTLEVNSKRLRKGVWLYQIKVPQRFRPLVRCR